jgi:predicted acyl esterase
VAWRFTERGYNVLIQDVRGRFDSAGSGPDQPSVDFDPFRCEASDGRATLDWIMQLIFHSSHHPSRLILPVTGSVIG